MPYVDDFHPVLANAIKDLVGIPPTNFTRIFAFSVLQPLYGCSPTCATASRKLAITFRAPPGERATK
jgi:hypothetical protein